jgi:hypothetical protein
MNKEEQKIEEKEKEKMLEWAEIPLFGQLRGCLVSRD